MKKILYFLSLLCIAGFVSGCDDDSDSPAPTPAVLPQPTLEELVQLMGEEPAATATRFEKNRIGSPTTDHRLRTDCYAILQNDSRATLKVEAFPEKMMSMIITPENAENPVECYTAMRKLIESHPEYRFKSALIGSFTPEGVVDKSNVITDLQKADAEMAAPDLEHGFYKFGYAAGDQVISVELDCGRVSMVIRTLYFPTEWMWYTTFFGRGMTSVINEYYFSIKSVGMVPPASQIFILGGRDEADIDLNIVFFAEGHNPISRLEATYQIEDPDEAKLYWIDAMSAPDVEEKYGRFESAVVFPLNNDEQPIEFRSLPELIQWVHDNNLAWVNYILPVFRPEGDWVISPQIDTRGFAVTVTRMETQPDSRMLHVSR